MAVDASPLIAGFAAALRDAGLEVPVESALTFARAAALDGLGRERGLYWAGRATLVRDPDDIAAYDRTFASYWGGLAIDRDVVDDVRPVSLVVDDDAAEEPTTRDDDGERLDQLVVRWSDREQLRDKDFATCSDDELAEAYRLMADLQVGRSRRPSRRRVPARHRGAIDLRRTLRAALRSGGEPVRLARVTPGSRPRRLVVILDVSGSMEPYARALIRFTHIAVASHRQVEAFALGTRLTRLTRELSTRDPDRALRAAAGSVVDWAGGTRLGEGLRAFNDRWGVRGTARGAIVVLLSDGWDRGDPQLFAEQMARLSRVAHRVVWVNPLRATPGYEPLARGMAAALPHVDDFVDGHSLRSLEALGQLLDR